MSFVSWEALLRQSILKGNYGKVKECLDHGANPSDKDCQGISVLALAMETWQYHIINILLEYGASPNERQKGIPALARSCMIIRQNTTMVRLLLDRGADVNGRDMNNWTAVMHASWLGFDKVIRLLAGQGANVNLENKHGNTALVLATLNGHDDAVKVLLEYGAQANNSAHYPESSEALINAATEGFSEICSLLLDYGAALESKDEAGSSPLLLAAEEGHCKVVRMLLSHKANTASHNGRGETALMRARATRRHTVVELIMAHEAQIAPEAFFLM
eukprot:CAMPEP_0184697230 /NCGR_PEP_ID=MMETSP0313-20130426/4256_1 /TAXON_ID=2792 /ORGANISM="Porphyridium aerugineum, Strain SAG 1380-2" /LENGTH=274 /DNA_ID=CAMNT_0027155995 /DNA_START=191 /DNA_END=1015 /DNA_ORIENTATION=-